MPVEAADPASASMLAVKTVPPKIGETLWRPRLIAAAEPGMRRRLVVISAPGGYGKTTLMAQMASSFAGKHIWYRLSGIDRNPNQFINNLILSASLITCKTDEVSSVKRLRLARDVHREAGFLLATLVEESSQDEEPLGFFLDDFHLLDKGFAAQLINQLTRSLPSHAIVVIACRTRPQARLGRLRSLGLVNKIEGGDLEFSPAELEELLTCTWGLEVQPATIGRLSSLTEGWIAGTILIIDALRKGSRLPGAIEEQPNVFRNVFDYMAEEVFDHQTLEMQELLERSSLMDVVDPQICDNVLAAPNARVMFQLAERKQLFLRRTCDAGELYRFHPLFRRFLQSKLAAEGDEKINGYRLQVGKALESAGRGRQAVEQYLAGACYKQALEALSAVWEELIGEGEYSLLERWLKQLQALTLPPALQICAAEAMMAAGKYRQAIVKLRRAKAKLAPVEQGFICRAAIDLADCFNESGDAVKALEELQKIPLQGMPPQLRFDIACKLGELSHEAYRYKDAVSYQNKAIKLLEGNSLGQRSGSLDAMLAAALSRRGELSCAHDLLKEALCHNKSASQLNLIQVRLAECLLKQGAYDECLNQACKCLDWVHKKQEKKSLPLVLDIYGSVLIASGRVEEGEAYLEQAADSINAGETSGVLLSRVLCHLGSFERRRRDFTAACRYHQKSMSIAKKWGDQYLAAAAKAGLAADLLLLGDAQGAVAYLTKAEKMASRFNFGYILTQIDLYRAWAAHIEGLEKEKKRALGHALARAHGLKHHHFILQEGKVLASLLSVALLNTIELDYVSWIIARIGKKMLPALAPLLDARDPAVRANACDLIGKIGNTDGITLLRRLVKDEDPATRQNVSQSLKRLRSLLKAPSAALTNREEQILRLVATGASNANIAKQLFISEKTVKTHVNRIFKKLGLTNRLEAAIFYRQTWAEKNTTFRD